MKKILFLFALLASMTASATVTVTPLSVDYPNKKVTFSVSWTGSPANNRVWVWIDLSPITGTSPGTFEKAEISGATATAGSIDAGTLNGRGFYVTANPSTVTATLNNATGKFNWCVYGSDYPPNATLQSGGGYLLSGTPPFIINASLAEPSHIFGAGTCVMTITDLTGCPGFVINPPVVPGAIPSSGDAVCAGGTPQAIVGITPYSGGDGRLSYSWYKNSVLIPGATDADYTPPPSDATIAGAYTYTRRVNDQTCNVTPLDSDGSWELTVSSCYSTACNLYVAQSDIMPAAWTASGGCPSGWRQPTANEMGCLYENRSGLLGDFLASGKSYWTTTDSGSGIASGRALVVWDSCTHEYCTSNWAGCTTWNVPAGHCYDVPKSKTHSSVRCIR